MNDRAVALLEQYDVEVLRVCKGRGAILCDTDKGCLIFKEYTGNLDRIRMQNTLLQHISGLGKVAVESIVPTKEGELFVKDNDEVRYVLKTYREGRECNIYDKAECMEAVRLLAHLHDCTELPADTEGLPHAFSQTKEYEKHNKELKRVRKYLQQRSQKSWFEISLLNAYQMFLEQALTVTKEWSAYAEKLGRELEDNARIYCHGDYQYHNILRSEEGWFLINFEKCMPDNPIRDLYLLMRKLLEKSNWSVSLGRELLETYEKERPISAISRIDLYYRLAYPEKFWKIVNFYYNSGKAWIPERNREKLEKLVRQEESKQHFLDEVFRDVSQMRA
ncbi:MAG: CotS family spore coat protein [Bacteroidales bacterium]|nr:CotS family spore coat protein [Lachnoclostridium sp.]MCM1384440.1 CotS family spore coat protein [Lachnoclostridium sp.]MCM1465220.1 CotS family spore coat protein [Bacteroidales bacterium]